MNPNKPWWNVIARVGNEQFGGMGESLAEAVEHLRTEIDRDATALEKARAAVREELDRVRL